MGGKGGRGEGEDRKLDHYAKHMIVTVRMNIAPQSRIEKEADGGQDRMREERGERKGERVPSSCLSSAQVNSEE